jgi:calcium/calmodulin-dependent protein kinase I
MTAHQALQHAWIKPIDPSSPEKPSGDGEDLLPVVKKNFNARRTLHKAIDTVRAINKLREGGALMAGHMGGAMSVDPKPKAEMVNGSKVMDDQGQHMEGLEGMAHGGSGALDPVPNRPGGGGGRDAMDIDSRSNARGQTEEQIRLQEKKIHDTVSGMWTKNRS